MRTEIATKTRISIATYKKKGAGPHGGTWDVVHLFDDPMWKLLCEIVRYKQEDADIVNHRRPKTIVTILL
jgi:hypothetical protein